MKRTILAAAILFSAILIVAPAHAEEMKNEVLVPNALDLTGPPIPIGECIPLGFNCIPFRDRPSFCDCLHDDEMGKIEQFLRNIRCRYAYTPKELDEDEDVKFPPELMEAITKAWQEIIRNVPEYPTPNPEDAKLLSKALQQVCYDLSG